MDILHEVVQNARAVQVCANRERDDAVRPGILMRYCRFMHDLFQAPVDLGDLFLRLVLVDDDMTLAFRKAE